MQPIEELRYLILGAQREGARSLHEVLRPHGLTPAQAEVLDVLRVTGRELTVKEIGRRLITEQGSPSRLVNALVGKGLLTSRRHPDDGRATAMRLTAKGRAIAAEMTEAKRALDERIAQMLDEDAAADTRRLLRAFLKGTPAGNALELRLQDEEATDD